MSAGNFRSFLSFAEQPQHVLVKSPRAEKPAAARWSLKGLGRRASTAILRTVRSQPRLREASADPMVGADDRPPVPPLPPMPVRIPVPKDDTRPRGPYLHSPYASPYALARRDTPSPPPEASPAFRFPPSMPRFRGAAAQTPHESCASFFDDSDSECDELDLEPGPEIDVRPRRSSWEFDPHVRASVASSSSVLALDIDVQDALKRDSLLSNYSLGAEFAQTLLPEPAPSPEPSVHSDRPQTSESSSRLRDKWLTRAPAAAALDLATPPHAHAQRVSLTLPSPASAATSAFPPTPRSPAFAPEPRIHVHDPHGAEVHDNDDGALPVRRPAVSLGVKPRRKPIPLFAPPGTDWTLSLPHLPLPVPPPPYEHARAAVAA